MICSKYKSKYDQPVTTETEGYTWDGESRTFYDKYCPYCNAWLESYS